MNFRRVLVVQPYGIGDLLFLTPVLRALRLLSGIERVDMVLGSRTEKVVRNNPHVDRIFVVDKDLAHRQGPWRNFREALALGRNLRAGRYDLLLDYSLRGEFGFWGRFFMGIPVRAGYHYRHRGWFHNRRLKLPAGFCDRHMVEYACDLAEKAGVPVENRWMEIYPAKGEAADAGHAGEALAGLKGRRYMVLVPGGGESWGKDAGFKRWPVENFAALAPKIASRLGMEAAVILGSPGEKDLGALLAARLSLPAFNLAGELDFEAAVQAVDGASVFLGNDGGLLHVACARRVPAAGLYGPVDPVVYGPYPPVPWHAAIYREDLECRPCYRRFRYNSECRTRECLQDLDVERVYGQLEAGGFFRAVSCRLREPSPSMEPPNSSSVRI